MPAEAERWRVFLDTNVFIAGLASQTGASAALLDLGEAEEILVVVSPQVLVELDRVMESKFPHLVDRCRDFIKNLAPFLTDDPTVAQVREAQGIIDKDDAPILAAAKLESVDYLVTLDVKHFHTPKVRAFFPTPILTPAQFLDTFRKFWEQAS